MRALLVLLVGCGNITNDVFSEDANFAAAFPAEDRTTLATLPGAEAAEKPELLALTLDVGTGVNGWIYGVLDGVNTVRSAPPNARTDETRSWGPYDWNGLDLTATSERTGGLRYDWDLYANGEGFSAGAHYAGNTVATGDGDFTWDQTALSEQSAGLSLGRLAVQYDNRDGVDLLVGIDDWSDGVVPPADADYAYRYVTGSGDLQYRAVDEYDFSVRTRWLDQVGARADAELSGGDLAQTTVWTQCWGNDGALTYQADTAGFFEPVGAETACALHETLLPDRI